MIYLTTGRCVRLCTLPRGRLFLAAPGAAFLFVLTATLLGTGATIRAADEYWRTDGQTGDNWLSSDWNIGSANTTGGTGWTAGNNAVFSANSTLTFATTTVGNVTVADGVTTTVTAGGTLTLGGVRTFTVGTGSTLTWTSQSQSTTAAKEGAGLIKSGAGTLNWGAGPGTNVRYDGGTTINAGTLIVSGANALSSGALTLNGGTLQSSSTQAFTSTSIVVGGDFTLAGTGNANFDLATTIALGSTTRNITNSATTGSRQFRGLISGGTGVGMTFAGSNTSTDQLYIGNTGNTFSGPVTINGGEVVFNGDSTFGNSTSIVIDGGRLTIGAMSTSGTVTGVNTTIASTRAISLGNTAGTSISISSGGSVTTYNGALADKSGATGGILVKQGGGTLALGGVSTYSGDTFVNNGTIQLTIGDNRLPTGTALNLGQAGTAAATGSNNVGMVDLAGVSQQVAGLNSTTYLGTSSLSGKNTITTTTGNSVLTLAGSGTYAYGDGSTTNSGVITDTTGAGSGSSVLSLVKSGTGTQVLGDANTYTGGTTISGGKLRLTNASGSSATGSGPVVLNGGTLTTLSGTGFSTGLLTVTAGSRLAPGINTGGTNGNFGVAGTLTIGGGSSGGATLTNANLDFDLANTAATAGGSNDLLTTAGTLTLGILGVTINELNGSLLTGTPYTLINGASTVGGFNAANITTTYVAGGTAYTATYMQTASGLQVSFSPVPEPTTAAGIFAGAALLILGQRRRRA